MKPQEKDDRSVTVHVEFEKGAVTSQRFNGQQVPTSPDDAASGGRSKSMSCADSAPSFGVFNIYTQPVLLSLL